MAGRQDPPGHALVIIAGPKAGADGKNGRMGPPGGDKQANGAGRTKASPEEAIVIRENEHCIDCQNYNPQDGSCEEVDGQYSPADACKQFFEPIGDQEPDADDQGGMSDQDSDDDGGGQAA